MSETHDTDAIVIGSGFGGAVAAARLAQAGYRVLILERGRRWNPGDFPRDPVLEGRWLWAVDHGLYDIRGLGGMFAVQAAGYGGGSLAYANVFARPSDAAMDPRWPGHLRRETLDPYYDLAAHMLEVTPVGDDPRTSAPPPRTALIEQLMAGSDRPEATVRPNLAVTFGDPSVWRPNRHGVARRGCSFVGDCVIGCNQGAKNSLDVTYLAVAEAHGARSVTDAEAIRITSAGDGYLVTTRSPTDPTAPPNTWKAPRVFLAAGAVASTELLLRSRDVDKTLPHLSPLLGHGFSGNGDFLTLARLRKPHGDMTTGPTITTNTVLDVPEGRRSVWYQVQDGAFPVVLHQLFDAIVPGQRARHWWRKRFATHDPHRVFTVLAMGHDSGQGTLKLDNSGRASLAWQNRWQASLYKSQRRIGPLLARLLDARLAHPFTWSVLRKTTTVHPLGGVPAGKDATSGVVNDLGEVHGHPGLFVMDGSTLPSSTGVNPSATILAAAERSIETIIRGDGKQHWQAPEWTAMTPTPVPEDAAADFSAELKNATSGGGVSFRERMISASNSDTRITMRLAISTPSIDALLADPEHTLTVQGSIDVDDVVDAAFASGTLALFPDHGGEAMRYELTFHDDTGSPWTLSGTKTITKRTPWRLLRDLTNLTAIVGPDNGTVPAITTKMRIGAGDLARMTSSVRGIGFTRARRLKASARFMVFFARSAIRSRSA